MSDQKEFKALEAAISVLVDQHDQPVEVVQPASWSGSGKVCKTVKIKKRKIKVCIEVTVEDN